MLRSQWVGRLETDSLRKGALGLCAKILLSRRFARGWQSLPWLLFNNQIVFRQQLWLHHRWHRWISRYFGMAAICSF